MNKYTLRQTPLAATIGSVLATGSLHAATITVDTANDTVAPGECSLRAAIESANTGMAAGGCDPGSAAADEIVFDEALAGSVITLGSGLVIENSLTITGPGADQLTIDGDELYRHFEVDLGKYQEVMISGITLANGYAIGDGGAIRMQLPEADLTLEDVVVRNNYSTANGGAVAFSTGLCGGLTIRDSVLTDNEAGGTGGAVAFDSYYGCELTIENSVLAGNRAVVGGSVSAFNYQDESPQISISNNSLFALNEASYAGGGIFAYLTGGAGIEIQDSTFFNNRAPGGGAIAVEAKYAYAGDGFSLAIQGSEIAGNQGYYGGGILAAVNNVGNMADATITIADSGITHNRSLGYGGGGIMFAENSDISITGSTISGNSSDYLAGGLFLEAGDSSILLSDSQVTYNQAGYISGGIDIRTEDSHLTIERTAISGNLSGQLAGGAVALGYGDSMVKLRDSELSLNTALQFAGAYILGQEVEIENTTISGNHALDQFGGMFAIGNTVYVSLTTVADNAAGYALLGGAYIGGYADCVLENSLIARNSASGYADLVAYCDTSYTLIGDGAGSIYTDAGGNIVDVDPEIGPLTDNGGPTATHALNPASPAINAGDPAFTPPPDYDQRGPGFDRVAAGRVDMGAYEFQGESGLTLSTHLLNFGGVPVNATAGPMTVTAESTGTATVQIGTVGPLSGSGAAAFDIVTDGCGGMTLAPAGTCDIEITFTPDAQMSFNANFEITSDAPSSPDSVDLTGTGFVPDDEVFSDRFEVE